MEQFKIGAEVLDVIDGNGSGNGDGNGNGNGKAPARKSHLEVLAPVGASEKVHGLS
jgi:hypothetical protein